MGVDYKPITADEANIFWVFLQFEEIGRGKKDEGKREAQNCLQIAKGEL
jgi:hypothetical protein